MNKLEVPSYAIDIIIKEADTRLIGLKTIAEKIDSRMGTHNLSSLSLVL